MKRLPTLAVLFAMLALACCLSATPAYGQDGIDYPNVAGCPKFSSVSDEPLLLRYQFRDGQKTEFTMDMDMAMTISGGMTIKMKVPMTMKGHYKIDGVEPNGDANLVTQLTRITMKITGGPMEMSFDSKTDPKPSNPAFKPLAAMLNVPMSVTMTTTGKTVKSDVEAIKKALKEAGGPGADQAMQQMDEMSRSSFIQLPEKAVKAGDTFDAGEIVQNMPNVGKMKTAMSYRVVAVSGDKKQVLLQPKAKFSMEISPDSPAQMKLDSVENDGWVLFDAEKGTIVRSAMDIKMVMKMSAAGQDMNMTTDIAVKYSISK